MYYNVGPTEYHHLKVKEVRYYMDKDNKEVAKLDCFGGSLDRTNPKRIQTKYNLNVYAYGGMCEYVRSEIDSGSNIFVVGRTAERRLQTGGKYYLKRVLEADFIFEATCLNYYKYYDPTKEVLD